MILPGSDVRLLLYLYVDLYISRTETELISKIVEDIIKKLGYIINVPSDDLKDLVGIDKGIEQITSLLDIGSLDVRIVGIWGMCGMGKTTLANVVFSQVSYQFEACSFLENVREESKRHGQNYLKNMLFSKLLGNENLHMVSDHFSRRRLRSEKALLVFDDVDDPT